MRKIFAGLAGLLVIGTPVIGAAQTEKIAHAYVENTVQGQIDKYLTDQVTAATKGEIKFQYFWAGSLGKANEILNLIGAGAVDMGDTAPIYFASDLPIASLTNGAPLFKKATTAAEFQDQMSRTDPNFLAEYKKKGVFPILQHYLANLRLACTKKVEKFDDLSGLRVRTYGAALPSIVQSLGMVPVSLDLNDTYEALDKGVVDCIALPFESFAAFKIYEVAKYWSNINLGAGSGPVLYASWKDYKDGGWSKEVVAAVDEAAKNSMAREAEGLAKSEKDAIAKAQNAGATLIEFKDQERVDKTIPDLLGNWAQQHSGKDIAPSVVDAIVKKVRDAQASE